MASTGLHHVTAISGPPRRNVDFYTRTLGLRLVKKTVNFDDPGTYHLYYGDELGQPGSILTFFPWAHVPTGRVGVGETQETAFRVPKSALGFWAQRLVAAGVKHETPVQRFGETVLSFRDPDGLALALVGVENAMREPAWTGGEVPADSGIRGFEGVTLLLGEAEPTAAILTDVLGFREQARDDNLIRYATGNAGCGQVVDIRVAGGFLHGRSGAGSVHHIAFRASGDVEQAEMVRRLAANHNLRATEQVDRNYFRSVYFREPGGVLFEIATDDPGFSVDEAEGSLGQALKLPPFLESHRSRIEAALPELA